MSATPDLRPAEPGDAARIREVAESSMTASYALSPQDIDAVVEAEFAEGPLADRIDADDAAVFVAETDGVLAGFAEVAFPDGEGVVRWLHVDPERRGAGVGTALFERATDVCADRGVAEPRAVTLAANNAAGSFFERFGLERVAERSTEYGGRETVEYVYADDPDGAAENGAGADAEGGQAARDEDETARGEETDGSDDATARDDPTAETDVTAGDYPDAVSTDDGEKVHLGEDPFRGSEGLFVPAFLDAARSERYGFYCLHCGSADVSVDSMERVRCGDCGNTRKPDDDYDGSYL